METCEVLIVGGGPGGSSCAWQLGRRHDVMVIDRALFPRDKLCAGWITPEVVSHLQLDVDEYRRGRTFQPITGFRTGVIGAREEVDTTYDRPISFGIRRTEFDHYLLQRSGARLKLGAAISTLRRDGGDWIVNESIRARMLVGAGGHFCPVARWLNPTTDDAPLVVAQEVEFAIDPDAAGSFTTAAEQPELYFSHDLKGYGWCFRKQRYINVGIGRLDRRSLPQAHAEFLTFLKTRGKIPLDASWRPRGHAYLLSEPPQRRVVAAGVMLVGDAAGLAYPQSGEGIRPAIESGLLAASTIAQANGCYTRDLLEPYEKQLRRRYAARPITTLLSRAIPTGVAATAAPWLLRTRWFVRHVVLNRWFLRGGGLSGSAGRWSVPGCRESRTPAFERWRPPR